MITIFHNPRCSKSRNCNLMLEKLNEKVEVINYMKTPFSFDSLSNLIRLLNIEPMALVRTNEVVWKENFKGKDLSDSEIIQAMIDQPKLIERPIIVGQNKAVIGRPSAIINLIVYLIISILSLTSF